MASHEALSRSFGAAAASYESGRPDYPDQAVRWLLGPVPDGRALRVADVGAGTGKLTRAAARVGAELVAVDPDPDMLAALTVAVPGVPTLVGTAESLPLPDASIDAVILGQAWHWVEPVAGCREIGRVLRPGGALGLVWNIRDESVSWVHRLGEIIGGSRAEQMIGHGAPPLADPFVEVEHATWHWVRQMDRAALTDLVHSRSGVITADPEDRTRIECDIADLFDQIGAVADRNVDLPYVTHAFRSTRP